MVGHLIVMHKVKTHSVLVFMIGGCLIFWVNTVLFQLVKKLPSLSCSQELASGLYHEPDASVHTFPFCFFKMYLNFILPVVLRSSVWSLYFRFSHQTPLCISLCLCVLAMSSSLIWSPKWWCVKGADHEAPYAVFLSLLLSPEYYAPSM